MILIKKQNSKTLPGVSVFGFVTAALVVALFIVVAAILAFGANKPDYEKPSEDKNNIEDLSQENKQILGLGDAKEQQKKEAEKKAEEDAKTENYKRYEQLSEEEQSQLEIIPTQYTVNDEPTEENQSDLPSKFDLRDIIEISRKDQASHGLCWDFASLRSTETNLALRKNENRDFSEMHVSYLMSSKMIGTRNIDVNEGGNFDTFIQYANYTGLVDEEKVPYKTYEEDEYLDFLDLPSDTRVTSVRKFKTSDYNIEEQILDIKNHVQQYGSVVININGDLIKTPKNNISSPNEGVLYCPDYSYNCSWSNHAISIIGWDDNYSKDNFYAVEKDGKETSPSKNGAWIAMNSWGESSEIVYISYEDYTILDDVSGVVSTNPEDGTKIDDLFKTNEVKDALSFNLQNIGYEYSGEKYIVTINDGKLYDVTTIDLSNKEISDETLRDIVDDLSNLPNIGYIDLSHNNISDLSLLKELWKKNKYISINLEGNQISDLTPLEGLEIQNLQLANNPLNAPIDLSNTTIISLDISNTWALENELEIKLPKGLISLNIDNTGVSSLSQLKQNSDSEYSISSLSTRGNYLVNLEGLENDLDIYNLDISENPISNFDALKNILADSDENAPIVLTAENIGLSSLEPLNGIKISNLSVADNEINNFDNFDCDGLYQLNISNNQGISGFSKCSNLASLVANSIGLSDLNEVLSLSKLYSLSLDGENYIDDYQELDKIESLIILSVAGDKTIDKLPRGLIHINLSDTGLNNQTEFDNMLSIRSINLSNNPELTDYENIYNLVKKINDKNNIIGFSIIGADHLSQSDYERIKELSNNVYFENAQITIPVDSSENIIDIEKGSDLRKIGLRTMLWTYGKSIEGGYFTKDAKELVFTKPEVNFTESAQVTYRIVRN